MQLWLIRHPRPAVAAGLCYGRSDLEPEEAALHEARARLAAQLPAGLPLFSSPLRRCARLAEALAPGAVRYDARLMEMDFGDWEMRNWQDIDREQVDAWNRDLLHFRPGGGESLADMAARVDAFCRQLHNEGLRAAALVCHAGTIRLIDARCRRLPAEAAAAQAHDIAYGSLTVKTLSTGDGEEP